MDGVVFLTEFFGLGRVVCWQDTTVVGDGANVVVVVDVDGDNKAANWLRVGLR